MRLNPGRLDTRCKFWEETATSDGMGSYTYSWEELAGAPSWCRFEPLKGMERIEAGKVAAGHHAKITVRRCQDIETVHKVDVKGERWNITSPEDYGREGWMVLWIHRTA